MKYAPLSMFRCHPQAYDFEIIAAPTKACITYSPRPKLPLNCSATGLNHIKSLTPIVGHSEPLLKKVQNKMVFKPLLTNVQNIIVVYY